MKHSTRRERTLSARGGCLSERRDLEEGLCERERRAGHPRENVETGQAAEEEQRKHGEGDGEDEDEEPEGEEEEVEASEQEEREGLMPVEDEEDDEEDEEETDEEEEEEEEERMRLLHPKRNTDRGGRAKKALKEDLRRLPLLSSCGGSSRACV